MDIHDFIRNHLLSTDHLRILLLLRTNAPHEWAMLDIVGQLYLPPENTQKVLASLEASGLVVSNPELGCFRYAPRSPELDRMVEAIAELDRERPVTLLNMIHSRSRDLQDFANAFKLRKEDDP